jgi:queuine tRNA-ribosyltransferase
LTDSGGFQAFSLSPLRKITEEGITFRSHINGDEHLFTPEKVVDIQRVLGSDILMPLDVCLPYPSTHEQAVDALLQTTRWAQRTQTHMQNTQGLYGFEQTFFPIIQGGMFPDLRKQSAEQLLQLNQPGYAIGGVSVGEPDEKRFEMIEVSAALIPDDKPRYLMGVGTPADLKFAIAQGIDMFDCVLPTRLARHGSAFTWDDKLNIKNEKFKNDFSPLLEGCDCYCCQNFSKAYLRHLHMAGEILAIVLMSMHNIRVLIKICENMKAEIINS